MSEDGPRAGENHMGGSDSEKCTRKPPILVLADDGPSVFETIAHVERCLEPIDVRNGEYRAFDGEGFPLRLSTAKEARRGLLKVGLEVTRVGSRMGESSANKLTQEVCAWVETHYPGRRPELTGTFSQLIEKLVEWFGYQK
jgi:hypothetical protein